MNKLSLTEHLSEFNLVLIHRRNYSPIFKFSKNSKTVNLENFEDMERTELKNVFNYLEMKHKSLTPYQADFVKSLKKYYTWKGYLSTRQTDCLLSLKDYLVTTE